MFMTGRHRHSGVLIRIQLSTHIDTILSIYKDDLYVVVKSKCNIEILFM